MSAALLAAALAIGLPTTAVAAGSEPVVQDFVRPSATESEHRYDHSSAPSDKREFRAIHNMDDMHRMGGMPGMGLEGGRIQVPPPAEQTGNAGKPQ